MLPCAGNENIHLTAKYLGMGQKGHLISCPGLPGPEGCPGTEKFGG